MLIHMTGEEKKQLYTLLKTSVSWLYGCIMPEYEIQPDFSDDCAPDTITPCNTADRESSSIVLPSLDSIAEAISACTKCQLCRNRHHSVPGMGVPEPFVLVIGEGPGADEDATGRPFVGRAGQLLDKMLAAISLSRTANCFIANIVKCRPPNNRDPFPEESKACRPYLEAQIQLLRPKMILAVGRIAAQNLLNTSEGIGRLHGSIREYNGIPFMATYHPSALLRNVELKRPAWEDLKIFRSYLQKVAPGYEQPFLREQTHS